MPTILDLNAIKFENHTLQEVVELVGDDTSDRKRLSRWLIELIELREYREEVLRASRHIRK